MKLAATACTVGLDGWAILRDIEVGTPDWFVVQAVVERAVELEERRDRSRAVKIANAVGKLFG